MRQSKADRSSLPYHSDIEKTKWLAEQQIESSKTGFNFKPPRIVLISSNIKRRDHLLNAVKKEDNIISIPYDFNHSTFSGLIAEINTQLERYRPGCKARSVLLFCQGGPGYLYLLKNKVLTREKLARLDNKDMATFWKELGCMISKIEPKESIVHIMGCFFLGSKQGQFVMQDMQDLMHPNVALFDAPVEASVEGRQMIETYFDYKDYKAWKFQYQPRLTSYQLLRESFHWGEEDMLVAGQGTSMDKPSASGYNKSQQRKSIHSMGSTVSELKSSPRLRRQNTLPSYSES
ncbi:NMDA receptor synaptonuclear signaling and neuronal migration factor-like [Tubulanus polymorphus]|uniref:NMDA receptor synaptonuclear signaling and neuronal migration factor-like n=1 Tax=Tubulanus polymorphus TaxID=672921 RepID=UPI003DA2D664